MNWTVFWTDYLRLAKKINKVKHNPIFIEANQTSAISKICDLYGGDVIDTGKYEIKSYASLEEATAYFRGCVLRDIGFLEESRGSHDFPYFSLSNYLKQTGVLFIACPPDEYYQEDGWECCRCKEFVFWAEPNRMDGTFICRNCKIDPYR